MRKITRSLVVPSLFPKSLESLEELEKAVAALDECAAHGGFLWKLGLSFDKKGYKKFKTPEIRKILADAGREAMQKDREAVEQFEKILQKEKL